MGGGHTLLERSMRCFSVKVGFGGYSWPKVFMLVSY